MLKRLELVENQIVNNCGAEISRSRRIHLLA